MEDNCPLIVNPSQDDFDGDLAGDVCDTDDDNDAVLDADDACPGTTMPEFVNDQGCSVADLCPCGNNWKNHGAYVSCVAHASGDLLDAGILTDAERDALVAAEAETACGKKK